MRRDRWSLGVWVLGLTAALACGCSGGPTGEVSLSVAALSAADVDRVEVTITGAGIDPPIVQELSRAGSQWRGAIGGIPAGTDRTFDVVAYDAGGMPIYTGTATGVEVLGDDTITVVIVLQDAVADPPGMESPPEIHSVSVIPGILSPSETASVVVDATDPDVGDALTYAWTATDGTFADPSLASTTWTAPAVDGVYTLTITVTDSEGSARSVSVDVEVSAANVRGTARIEVTVNTWPDITRFAVSPGLLAPGASGNVLITASDADGDAVSHTITDDCGGSIAGLVWTAPAVAPGSGECELTLRTIDGRGGESFATATVYVGEEIMGNHAPVIDRSFQSNWEAGAGDVLSFDVTASDVDGDALTFTWTATSGALGAQVDTATTSANTWTSAGTNVTITARVTDASGLWDEVAFVVRAGWLHDAGSAGDDEVTRVAASANALLFAVRSNGTYDVEGTTLGSGPDFQITVVRADTSGRVVWSRAFGGGNQVYGLAFDATGNAYVGGYFSGTLDVGGSVLTSAGGADLFVASYGAAGALRWARSFGSTASDEGVTLAVDSARGRVYASGQLASADPVDLGGGARTIGAPYSGFVLALSAATGDYVWDQTMNGTGGTSVNGLAVDPATGDVVTTAVVYTGGSINPGVVYNPYCPAGSDAAVFALSFADGMLAWPNVVGFTNHWTGHPGAGYVYLSEPQIAADGRIFFAAHFEGGFARAGSLGWANAMGGYDTVLVSMNTVGAVMNLSFVRSTGGDDLHIAMAADGTIWAAGHNGATAVVPGWGTMHATGGQDAWLARYNPVSNSFTPTDGVRLATGNHEVVNSIAVRSGLQPVVVGWYDGTPTAEDTTLPFAGGNMDGYVWSHQGATP